MIGTPGRRPPLIQCGDVGVDRAGIKRRRYGRSVRIDRRICFKIGSRPVSPNVQISTVSGDAFHVRVQLSFAHAFLSVGN
jgi:hypothetical protein